MDRTKVNRPRDVGTLVPMSYRIFTMEKSPIGEPVQFEGPNEITLAQLVAFFIVPSGIQLDVGSVFYWNLREIESSSADKTKRKLEQIPDKIPEGFNLRVKCSSLRDASMKKMAHVRFGAAHMTFAMPPHDTIARLRERVASWMNQCGQGSGWTIEGADGEEIDSEWEYEVIPLDVEVPLRIFLKQTEMQVLPSTSWINLSDQLVKKWKLPKGTLLRIFPVIGSVGDQDDENHSYTINWEVISNIGSMSFMTHPRIGMVVRKK